MTNITITEKRLKELERDAAKLAALEAGGVDNWEWYDEAIEDWFKEYFEEELVEEFIENINEILIDATVDYPVGPEAGARIDITECEAAIGRMFTLFAKKYKDIYTEEG